MNANERITAAAASGAVLVKPVAAIEAFGAPHARFDATCFEANPAHRSDYLYLIGKAMALRERAAAAILGKLPMIGTAIIARLLAEADALVAQAMQFAQPKWAESAHNTVVTVGKNDLLDKYLAGSAYTAAWFCGLISSVSYSAIAAGDSMSSHAGWTEAGATNAPNYSGNRPALTFASASGGSKATSSASSFTFSGAGTIKGMFGTSITTKDGTTGILYNVVLFSGGDRAVVSSDVVNVSVTYSA